MMPDEPSAAFTLFASPLAKRQIRYLGNVADRTGSRESLYRTIKSIEFALVSSPREWGDPSRNLTGMKMIAYRRLFADLIVAFAVHESESLVWLHSIKPGPGHLLFSDPNYPVK